MSKLMLNPILSLGQKVDIRSTPTTIFLDKGFEIARAKGAPKRDQLIKAIKAPLAVFLQIVRRKYFNQIS